MLVGMKRDMHFGPLILFGLGWVGLGGIYVEDFKDVSFEIAPLNMADSIDMIKNVKVQ